jgi:serine/threonine protein kinase
MNDGNAPVGTDLEFQSRRKIDLLCRDFEEQWQNGTRLPIETILKGVEVSLQTGLLPELVAAEWEMRSSAGEEPRQSDYIARFPQLQDLLAELELTDFRNRESAGQLLPAPSLQVGEEFCGYRILRELGRGAMGTVFLAEVPVIGHQVALKVLATDLQQSHTAVTRFEREAKLLSKLEHPSLVPLYSYGEFNGLRYLVMKAINGVSLSRAIAGMESAGEIYDTIRSPGAASRSELLTSIARQLAEALKAVHTADVLHRDIKPSNILLTDAGHVFLTDFGLARVESSGFDITRSDEFVGTLRYCAPESLDGVYSRQGDIYSLGLVLFELFGLVTPFESSSRRELLNRKMSGVVPELVNPVSSIPEPVLQVLRRMTQYDPAARYQSAEEVVDALDQCWRGNASPRRLKLRIAMLVVATMLLLVVATFVSKTVSGSRDASADVTAVSAGGTSLPANTDTAVKLESSFAKYAIGHDLPLPPSDVEGWLIPERYFELPKNEVPASLVSLSGDGTYLMVVTDGTSLFMGPVGAPRLPLAAERPHSRIVAIDQSETGDLVLLVNQDFGRPQSNEEGSEARDLEYFVETFNQQRAMWVRIPGPFFRFASGMPFYISGPSQHNKRELLIPDPEFPVIWQPMVGGYITVPWPESSRAAISCFSYDGAAAMQDGKVVLFEMGFQDGKTERDPSRTIETTVRDCRAMRHSSDGRFVVVVGTSEACVISTKEASLLATVDVSNLSDSQLSFSQDGRWLAFANSHHVRIFDLATMEWHSEPLQFDDRLLLTTPLSDGLLTVEDSGHVRLTSLTSGASQFVHEHQDKKLTAAAFCIKARRLVLATKDAQILTFHVQ